ncbi:unnamed protein product, partial [Brassica oleracea var. botrytis]
KKEEKYGKKGGNENVMMIRENHKTTNFVPNLYSVEIPEKTLPSLSVKLCSGTGTGTGTDST